MRDAVGQWGLGYVTNHGGTVDTFGAEPIVAEIDTLLEGAPIP
jgi:hypothetical protein